LTTHAHLDSRAILHCHVRVSDGKSPAIFK
jgi:hypothetical protein